MVAATRFASRPLARLREGPFARAEPADPRDSVSQTHASKNASTEFRFVHSIKSSYSVWVYIYIYFKFCGLGIAIIKQIV